MSDRTSPHERQQDEVVLLTLVPVNGRHLATHHSSISILATHHTGISTSDTDRRQ